MSDVETMVAGGAGGVGLASAVDLRAAASDVVIPTIRMDGAQVIDLATVIDRRPRVALVDGLAYDNPAASANPHRWQDVEQLLNAGISVRCTLASSL